MRVEIEHRLSFRYDDYIRESLDGAACRAPDLGASDHALVLPRGRAARERRPLPRLERKHRAPFRHRRLSRSARGGRALRRRYAPRASQPRLADRAARGPGEPRSAARFRRLRRPDCALAASRGFRSRPRRPSRRAVGAQIQCIGTRCARRSNTAPTSPTGSRRRTTCCDTARACVRTSRSSCSGCCVFARSPVAT